MSKNRVIDLLFNSIKRSSAIVLFTVFFGISLAYSAAEPSVKESKSDKAARESKEFASKLKEMVDRLNKSVELIRVQITESQNAPFLPDLYLQLGELLNQKANSIYYLQMERESRTDQTAMASLKFGSVVRAQKEAVQAFQVIIKDFPKFDKRAKTLYYLAVTLKSIDEVPEFMKVAGQLQREFPNSNEAMKTRILLAQHYYDLQQYDEVESTLAPVRASNYNYEKNMAKYKIALVYLIKERFIDALKLLEEVIVDPDLKDQDQPIEVSLKTKSAKAGLKREALIDSIRAYTQVFKDNPEPLKYYSRIAPSEVYFQEVIEKLAYRYITLKKYSIAISLFRALCERISNPQEVMKIYREVLDKAPTQDRMEIPASEMQYVLDRYNHWISFFNVPKGLRTESFNFFEKQVRELGTTSHDLAKIEKDTSRKKKLLARAADYYPLYLTYFKGTAYTAKMAMNYADVLFLQENYIQSGDYYLRTYLGEFGKPTEQSKLLQNAVFCLQKKTDAPFYEQVRARGLLMKAIQSTIQFDPKLKNKASLNFLYLKARFEQGFYSDTIEKLYTFMAQAKTTTYATLAGEMILDYYNTRNNLDELKKAASRMLKIGISDNAFNSKVAQIEKQTQLRKIQERAETLSKVDDFSEGKGYLKAALSMQDSGLRDIALQQALAASRSEKDVSVFFKTASLLAEQEKDHVKKAGLTQSLALESIKIARFYGAMGYFRTVAETQRFPDSQRISAIEEQANLALALKDFKELRRLLTHPLFSKISADVRGRISQQVIDLIESKVEIDSALTHFALNDPAVVEKSLPSLYRSQSSLPPEIRSQIQARVQSMCQGGDSVQAVCRWPALENLEKDRTSYIKLIQSTPPKLESVENVAAYFQGLNSKYQALDGSGDALLDLILSIRMRECFARFAGFLRKVGDANPDLKPVILQKVKETEEGANQASNRCRSIASQSEAAKPYENDCSRDDGGRAVAAYFKGASAHLTRISATSSDINDSESQSLRKKIFADEKNPDPYLELALHTYEKGYYHASAASGLYGASFYPGNDADFRAILGCSLIRMGLKNEGQYHLKTASDFKGLKRECQP